MKFNIQKMLYLGALVILGYLVIPPLLFTLRSSLYFSPGFDPPVLSLQNYAEILSTPETPAMLLNSFVFATGSSMLAIILGTLLAWIVERTDTPLKNVAYFSAYATFAVPGILKVIGWILLLGPEAGLINLLVKHLLGLQSNPFNIFTMPGMILIEAVVWTPVVFLFMAAPFRSMDPALEESATMCGVGIGRTFYHITLKLALPSLLSVLLLNFIRALEAFEIPALIGIPGGITVLTSEIFLKIRSGLLPKYGTASAYAIILIFFVAIGLYFYGRATRQVQKFYTITGKGFRPRVIQMGKWRYVTTPLVCLLPIFLVLPLLVLFWASLLPYYRRPSIEILSSLTFANYRLVFQNPLAIGALENSLIVGLISATLTIVLASIVAWVVVRTNISWRRSLDYLASFMLAFPGLVLGIALLVTYLTIPIPLYGTIWILIIGFITAHIPYGVRFCYPGLLQISKELEESAQMSGASWAQVFARIVVPLMLPSLCAGWIYVFLLSIRALSMPVLLSRPGTELISVLIFNLWEEGQTPEIGAFGFVITLILLTIAVSFQKLTRRYGLKQERQHYAG